MSTEPHDSLLAPSRLSLPQRGSYQDSVDAEIGPDADSLELKHAKASYTALESGPELPLPVLADAAHSNGSRRWERSREFIEEPPLCLPLPLKRALLRWRSGRRIDKVWTWLHGPQPPRELRIRPFFGKIETALDKLFAKLRSPLIIWPFLFVWIIAWAELVKFDTFSAETEAGSPTFITGTASFWSANAGCGLDGTACAPFSNSSFAFRCPSNTASVQLLNNRAVGPEEVIFQPLIVGGGDSNATYRADSFICQSAIHYGLFEDSNGGCGVVEQIGNFTDFIGVTRNGLTSVGFDTIFPSAFRFSSVAGTKCKDIRNEILIFNVVMMFLFSFVIRPPSNILYWTMVCVGFWYEALVLATSLNDISTAFGTFLPCLFIAYAFWRCTFRWILPHFSSSVLERSFILFVGYWVSVNADETWERLPLQRLLPQDISKEPGALATLIVLIVVIAVAAIIQLWYIRLTGWLPYYLTCYAIGGIIVGLLAAVPDMTIRVHHYILAMVLLPLTAFPTRLGLLLAGLLLGLFLSGAAEWGLAAFLQTASQLQGDAPQGTDLPSFVNTSANFNASSRLLAFSPTPANISSLYDGFALIVDDVEVQQGTGMVFNMSSLNATLPHYFRLAYLLTSGSIGDFTRAATWFPSNGTWVDPQPGPS